MYEYIVPAGKKYLLDEIRLKIKNGESSPDVPSVYKLKLRKVVFEPINQTELLESPLNNMGFVDAKYQKQFGLNGHTFKFVFEVFGYPEFYLLYYGTNSKFEYRFGKDKWCQASESVIKQISNFTVWVANGSPFPIGPTYLVLNWSGSLNSNQNLSYIGAVATDCLFDLRFTSYYRSNAIWANQVYEVPNAEWRVGNFCK
ncbi:MAG: hypothetical protein OHK0053_23490 [Microscillaceae bacterium]